MIKAFTELRFLATLRRIAQAMEEANRLEKFRQAIEYPPLAKTEPPPIRKVQISHPSVEQWNAKRRE